MLLDISIGGCSGVGTGFPSKTSPKFVITVSASSFSQLEEAVGEAIGDILPFERNTPAFFEIEYLPSLPLSSQPIPQLVVKCEETFSFLIELEGSSSSYHDCRRGSARPLLRFVLPAGPRSTDLFNLPMAVVASSSPPRSPMAATDDHHKRRVDSKSTSLTVPEEHLSHLITHSPHVLLLSTSEKISSTIPLGASLREMWRIITDRFPRVTKGVFRLVARPPPPLFSSPSRPKQLSPFLAQNQGQSVKQTTSAFDVVCVDIDAEDEFAILRPELLKGRMVLEAIDQCRGGGGVGAGGVGGPILQGPGAVMARRYFKLRDMAGPTAEGVAMAAGQGAPQEGHGGYDEASKELHERLDRHRDNLQKFRTNARSNNTEVLRAASLD